MVTASHNPPDGQRLQGVPGRRRADRAARRHRHLGAHRRRRPAGRRAARRRPTTRASSGSATRWSTRYLAHVPAVRLVPEPPATSGSPTRRCTASAATSLLRRLRARPACAAPEVVGPAGRARRRRSRRCRSRTPRSRGRWTCCWPGPTDVGADLALANDPDADRLGVADPAPDGWRLAGACGATRSAGCSPTTSCATPTATTGSSSRRSCRRRCCRAWPRRAGVHYAETFTGFKWIARCRARPTRSSASCFGYEQALGYLVTRRPLDKDGITAAVLLAEVAALAKAEGTTLEGRLADIEARFGRHVTAERSVPMNPAAMPGSMDTLRAAPPTAAQPAIAVTSVEDIAGRQPAALPPRGRAPASRSARAGPSRR